jgi:hypothetical protein
MQLNALHHGSTGCAPDPPPPPSHTHHHHHNYHNQHAGVNWGPIQEQQARDARGVLQVDEAGHPVMEGVPWPYVWGPPPRAPHTHT